jgi:hypothetical protein
MSDDGNGCITVIYDWINGSIGHAHSWRTEILSANATYIMRQNIAPRCHNVEEIRLD